jgi:hypothetical protein
MRSSQKQIKCYRLSHLAHIIIITVFLIYLTEIYEVHRRREQSMARQLHAALLNR